MKKKENYRKGKGEEKRSETGKGRHERMEKKRTRRKTEIIKKIERTARAEFVLPMVNRFSVENKKQKQKQNKKIIMHKYKRTSVNSLNKYRRRRSF